MDPERIYSTSSSLDENRKKIIGRIALSFGFLLLVIVFILALPPLNYFLNLLFPKLASKATDLEMGLFSILIGAYTIFISFLILAIEILDHKKLIRIRDILEDWKILVGSLFFFLFSFLPVLLIALGISQPTETYFTYLHLSLFFGAAIILIYLAVYLLRLLDSREFIKMYGKKIVTGLKRVEYIDNVNDLVRLRFKYLTQLNRFYDAGRVAIESFDSHILYLIEEELLRISLSIERNWTDYVAGESGNQTSKELIKKIIEKREDNEKRVKEIFSKFSEVKEFRWNKYEIVGEFIWEPIYRTRNLGEQIITFSKYRSDYRMVPEMLIKKAIDDGYLLTVKGIANIYWKLLVESERNYPENTRAQEVLGHGIIGMASYLYQKHPNESKELFDENKTIEKLPFYEGLYYLFKYPEQPIKDILLHYYSLIYVLEKALTLNEEQLTTIKMDAIFQQTRVLTSRVFTQQLLGSLPSDIIHFKKFYENHIRPKMRIKQENIF
ncbi:MAG: hypothetical protein GF308_13675 [Candidatus Heimdallarchaeota archaeon]|nr:hypothetical protein [Candidatus Heimdallarchaeota archaeon]